MKIVVGWDGSEGGRDALRLAAPEPVRQNRLRSAPRTSRTSPASALDSVRWTSLRQAAQSIAPVSDEDIADICASFQKAISGTLKDRIGRLIGYLAPQKDKKAASDSASRVTR